MLEFNINHYVHVKLTKAGHKELKRQHIELLHHLPQSLKDEYAPPKEDDEGFTKWQLWSLMNRFGHMLRMGGKAPFDTIIKIEDA
jgi:hypothetical protein|tara:strand:+ start:6024 stop:6278 length:255 start_codon:yes stop_codon:yes gene_type:complete